MLARIIHPDKMRWNDYALFGAECSYDFEKGGGDDWILLKLRLLRYDGRN